MLILLTAFILCLYSPSSFAWMDIPRCDGNSEGAMDDDHLGHRFQSTCQGTTFLENGEVLAFTSNRLGLRDKDYSKNVDKGTFRILLVGASQEVNHSRGSGFGVAFESKLNELLKQKRPKKIKKIEVINGSERAFNTIRSYLRLSELLDAYSPNAVVYVDPYLDLFLEEYFDHYRATIRAEDGAVASMGKYQRFWPIPEKFTVKLWTLPFAVPFFKLSSISRMTMLLYWQEWIGGLVNCPSKRGNCLVYWHNRYLDKIGDTAMKSGSQLVYVFGRRLSEDFLHKPLAQYLPSYWAERLFIKPVLPKSEVELYLKGMRARSNSVEMNAEMRFIYERSYEKVKDLHPREKDSNELGKILANQVFSKFTFE